MYIHELQDEKKTQQRINWLLLEFIRLKQCRNNIAIFFVYTSRWDLFVSERFRIHLNSIRTFERTKRQRKRRKHLVEKKR